MPIDKLAKESLTYKDAGVDIDNGNDLIGDIKDLAAATATSGVLGGLGGFGGFFALGKGYDDPVLVSGTDGVGTKLKTATALQRHTTIGIDLVAMAVNDILVTGAKPLFFLDYYATGKLDRAVAKDVIAGIAQGCTQADTALIGGETAELPGMYKQGDYDLAGFCVGVVERDHIRDGKDIVAGDVVIGLPSSGLHSNGHSLARKAILEKLQLTFDTTPTGWTQTIGDALLEPTTIYAKAFSQLGLQDYKAAAHITGGGLIENAPRVLPSLPEPVPGNTPTELIASNLGFVLDTSTWDVPPVFDLIASAGVEKQEMFRVFNMGIGMILVCDKQAAAKTLTTLAPWSARIIGEITSGSPPDGDNSHERVVLT